MRVLIPNTLSMTNLVLGFLAMLVASNYDGQNTGALFWPAVMILLAVIADGLDGPAARLLKVDSGGIGAQLDSLADLTTFGMAPGFLMYKGWFTHLGVTHIFNLEIQVGMLVAAIYPVCAAYRLARFNTGHEPDHFRGLPSPVGGLVVALFIITQQNNPLPVPVELLSLPFGTLALLMVSTIRYNKPLSKVRQPNLEAILRLSALGVLILVLTWFLGFQAGEMLLALIVIYIFSGFLTFIVHTIKRLRF